MQGFWFRKYLLQMPGSYGRVLVWAGHSADQVFDLSAQNCPEQVVTPPHGVSQQGDYAPVGLPGWPRFVTPAPCHHLPEFPAYLLPCLSGQA